MVKRDAGFTLVELLIVVSILLIIAAMAIPNFLRARMAANEASAVASCRTLNTAELTYSAYYQKGFTATLAQLGPPPSGPATADAADLIDVAFASGIKSGYTFTYAASGLIAGMYTTYQFRAAPLRPNDTGIRYFFTDPWGVIRLNVGGPAGPSSSSVH